MQRSPVRLDQGLQQIRRDAILAKATQELLRMHGHLVEKTAQVERMVAEVRAEAMRIRKLPKGDKGERGERGPQGIPGRSAPTLAEILERIPTPKDGADGRDADVEAIVGLVMSRLTIPQDGKDAIIDYDKVIADLYEKIKSEMDWRKIPGLENEMASYRNQLAGKVYGKNTWARGGGSSGGSSGTAVYGEVVDGNGTSWTLDNIPSTGTLRLYANGQRLTVTVDYTLSGANITTVQGWNGGTVIADYSYA